MTPATVDASFSHPHLDFDYTYSKTTCQMFTPTPAEIILELAYILWLYDDSDSI